MEKKHPDPPQFLRRPVAPPPTPPPVYSAYPPSQFGSAYAPPATPSASTTSPCPSPSINSYNPPPPPPPPFESYNPSSAAYCPSPSSYTPSSSYNPSLLPPPPPRPLRPVRSATNLTGAHAPQQSGFLDPRGTHQVDFVVDDIPTPASLSPGLSPTLSNDLTPAHEIRRVKSSSALSAALSSQEEQPKDSSKWKAALGEAQYFAGGLISHPAESNKHFSIIRHSHALIWYRGPATSVPITILSDEPLPPTRTIWMQQKGYSGNVGMSLKALMGTTGTWLNVTPASKTSAEHLPEADERGIQRDFKRFVKKASGKLKNHIPRETHIVRIPAAATDGYFRLVVCAGEDNKKILCGSPVFRIASTSTDVSTVRGSSLSTMPLEMGIKVATTIGSQVAKKYTGVAGAVVEQGAKRLTPSNAAIKKVAHTAYHKTGLGNAVSETWKNGKAGRYDPLVPDGSLDAPLHIIGNDEGPEAPFPYKFAGKVVRGTGISTRELGIPTANLSEVGDDVKMRMGGVFAAWARVVPANNTPTEDFDDDWHEAIVTIAPLRNAPPGVVQRNKVCVHILHDFEDTLFFDMKMKVMLMGYLHAASTTMSTQDIVEEHSRDVMTTTASLGRDAWGPEVNLSATRAAKSDRGFKERLGDASGIVQGGLDRIPSHWVGVRSEALEMRDQVYGNGDMFSASIAYLDLCSRSDKVNKTTVPFHSPERHFTTTPTPKHHDEVNPDYRLNDISMHNRIIIFSPSFFVLPTTHKGSRTLNGGV
ncbi:riboflavin kinase [Fusarium longipes]|uniref:Riboflavin kinase n=1 Tax=Fusarium longipes TaxID=694270 RepID=A0A395T0Z1_9HYPO|nr:riboflavin kinase [Fusarium longipes]